MIDKTEDIIDNHLTVLNNAILQIATNQNLIIAQNNQIITLLSPPKDNDGVSLKKILEDFMRVILQLQQITEELDSKVNRLLEKSQS